MEALKRTLKTYEIDLAVVPLESEGFYVPNLRTIFVDEQLFEESQKEVIWHELEHGLSHEEYASLYDSFVHHTKMEYEADRSMIENLIKEHGGHYNYSAVLEGFSLGMGWENRL